MIRLLLIVCLILLGSCKELKELVHTCTGKEVMLQESEVISNLEITETATEYIFSGTMERSDLTHIASVQSYFLYDAPSSIGDPTMQFPSGDIAFLQLSSGPDPNVGQVDFPSEHISLLGIRVENEFEDTSVTKVVFSATMPKQGTYNIALTKWVLEFSPVCATTPAPWLREQALDVLLSNK